MQASIFLGFARVFTALIIFYFNSAFASSTDHQWVFEQAEALEKKTIEWRRQIHQNPELGEQEIETAALVAKHLKSLGLEVHEGLAKTGVVGILKGSQPGPVIGLRADMDALPIEEKTKVPFASKKKSTYRGKEVFTMHACGHDAHTAILMATAELLTEYNKKNALKGSLLFIFQPAEEGPSTRMESGSVDWGARQMLKEGLFKKILKPDLIFGLHVGSEWETGSILYQPGPLLASYDDFYVTISGQQAHASTPWKGTDTVLASAKVVEALHQIVSRRVNYTQAPTVLTVGQIHGGVRENIMPSSVALSGTIRSHHPEERKKTLEFTKIAAQHAAATVGAEAQVRFFEGYGVTTNHRGLSEAVLPTLKLASQNKVIKGSPIGGAEDFSYFANEVPGFFFFLGVTPRKNLGKAPSNHSDFFYLDEKALQVGVRTMSLLAIQGLEIQAREKFKLK